MMSRYPLLTLGHGKEECWIREEDREAHFHVLGSSGEGKSKFLEHLMRYDIDLGNGFILLDPSEGMELGNDVLKYALSRGREVIVMNYEHFYEYGRMPTFNPLRTGIKNAMDNFKTLFGVTDETSTIRINKYLRAMMNVLRQANRPITHSIFFTEQEDKEYRYQREKILAASPADDRFRLTLEAALRGKTDFQELHTTIRRLEPIFHPVLMHVLSGNQINFFDVVRRKQILLVNLYAYKDVEYIHTNFLGIAIINELVTAMDILRKKCQDEGTEWKGKYYLYLDEAGRFVNKNLADALDYKRKVGLRCVISHQRFKQFDDLSILSAIMANCKVKIFFDLKDRADRDKLVKNMFQGDSTDRAMSHANANLKKRQCVVKILKQQPVKIRIPIIEKCHYKIDFKNLVKGYDYRRNNPVAFKPGTKFQQQPNKEDNQKTVLNPDGRSGETSQPEVNRESFARAWRRVVLESAEEKESK
jgi:hypothetical protein